MRQQQLSIIAKGFADALRKTRGERSQAEFARMLGIKHQQTYQAYEAGRVPSGEVLHQIASKLGVSVDVLLTGGKPTPETVAALQAGEAPIPWGDELEENTAFSVVKIVGSNTDKVIGFYLREARLALGRTLRDLENETGIRNSTIYRIESGEVGCSAENFILLCQSLAVPSGLMMEIVADANQPQFLGLLAPETSEDAQQILKRHKPKGKAVEAALLVFLRSSCMMATSLLRSSNPILLAQAITYPCPGAKDSFVEFAKAWGQRLPLIAFTADRRALLDHLQDFPLRTLQSQGLCTDRIVAEYLEVVQAQFAALPEYKTEKDTLDAFMRGKLEGVEMWYPDLPSIIIGTRQKPANKKGA